MLPDDDAGRDDLTLAAYHIAQMQGDVVKRIVCWTSLWAPWIPRCEGELLAERIAVRPLTFKAATLGWRLRLTDAERTALCISTIRAIDVSAEEMAERRKQRDRERKREARLRQRIFKPEPVSKSKPWQAYRISRATWYRRNKATGETNSVRSKGVLYAADRICLKLPKVAAEEEAYFKSRHRLMLSEPESRLRAR